MNHQLKDSDEEIFYKITDPKHFPPNLTETALIDFLHETMKPYEDSKPDIRRALGLAMHPEKNGFIMVLMKGDVLAGALVMLDTGMKGFIPEQILLFVSVSPDMRGLGIGRRIIEKSLKECNGEVKLHVEYDNPAKRLYERIGFTSKYAEMRIST